MVYNHVLITGNMNKDWLGFTLISLPLGRSNHLPSFMCIAFN